MCSKEDSTNLLDSILGHRDILEYHEIEEGIETSILVKFSDGQKRIVKIHETEWYESDGGFLAGPKLVRILNETETNIPLPKIYEVGEEPKPYYIMEYLENNEFNIDKDTSLIKSIGCYLSRINNIPIQNDKGFGYVKYDSDTDSLKADCSSNSEFIKEMLDLFVEDISDGGYTIEETDRESRFKDLIPKIEEVSNYTENNEIIDSKPCYCHWDYKTDNILVRNGEIVGIIDWENPIISDRLFNFLRAEELLFNEPKNVNKCHTQKFRNFYMNESTTELSLSDEKISIYNIYLIVENMRNFPVWVHENHQNYERYYRKRFIRNYNTLF